MLNRRLFIYSILSIYYLELNGKEILSDTGELIISHGYKNETHVVRTGDGYYLTLHRITGKQNDTQNNKNKPVVLVGHGIFGSSAVYVLAGPKKGLGYILSDEGYDVWLANFRGNKYSQVHDDYTIESKEFWDYSWHEMGEFDLRAMIEYILSEIEVEKIFYIGYSQGTTAYFVFSSLHPELADNNLHAAVALAPVVHMNNIELEPVVKSLSKLSNKLFEFAKIFLNDNTDASLYLNVGNNRKTLEETLKYLENNNLESISKLFRSMVYGLNESRTDTELLPLIYRHLPDGTSLKQLLHYAQIINSGVFQAYELSVLDQKNWFQLLFSSREKYDVSQCKVNTALFYSDKDWISTSKDVLQLEKELYSVKSYIINNFNHLDFIFATDVKEMVYDRVLEFMRNILAS